MTKKTKPRVKFVTSGTIMQLVLEEFMDWFEGAAPDNTELAQEIGEHVLHEMNVFVDNHKDMEDEFKPGSYVPFRAYVYAKLLHQTMQEFSDQINERMTGIKHSDKVN